MKTALITGANKGIGFEIARQLGRLGFHVVISGRSEEKLREKLEQLRSGGCSAEMLVIDVTSVPSIKAAAGNCIEKRLHLNVLINNAAIYIKRDNSLAENDMEVLRGTIETNCYGALLMIQEFLPIMKRPCRIINISSGGGSMTDPVEGWSPAYCASKTLLNAITRQLAYELQSEKVAVNAVCPGWVRTAMGGMSAPRSVQEGADTAVWLAAEAPAGLSGKFFRDRAEIPW